MNGMLVITRAIDEYHYTGFDKGYGNELWKYLKEWNNTRQNKLVLENDLATLSNLNATRELYNYSKQKGGIQESVSLIYLTDQEQETGNLDNHFTFQGYDCGYITDQEFPVFFSAIRNELCRNTVNARLAKYKSDLNAFGLFSSYRSAEEFQNKRQESINQGETDFIETAFDEFSIVRIFMYSGI